MTHLETRFLIPRIIWEDENSLSFWFRVRRIYGFFWEVALYGDFVVVELIDL